MRHIIFFLFLCIAPLAAQSWSPPILLPDSVPTSENVVVAINPSGQAVACWVQNGVINAAVLNGTTWTATAPIPFVGTMGSVAVVIDNSGNATATAVVSMVTNPPIQAATLSSGSSTWTLINNLPNSGGLPVMGVDGSGNVFAVWLGTIMTTSNIFASILPSNSSTWGSSTTLDSATSPQFLELGENIAVNQAGDAVVSWRFAAGFLPASNRQVRVATFNATSQMWTTNTSLEAQSPGIRVGPFVAIDSAGDAVAVWSNDTAGMSFSSNFTFNSQTWSASTNAPGVGPVSMFPNGDAWMVYVDMSGNLNVAFLPLGGSTWTNQQQLDDSADNPFFPQIVLNSSNGLIVWDFSDPITGNTVLTSAFLPTGSSTWTVLSPTITSNTNDSFGLGNYLAFSNNGTGVVVFIDDTMGSLAMASIFSISSPSPVSSTAQGEQIRNIFLTQTEYVNVITWSAPSGISAVKYNIFRDAALTQLAGTVLAPSLTFVDHNRRKKTTYTYFIVAVDASGNSTLIATVTVNPV
ncbi:MAG TPA: hypothetical protein VLG76_04655 [Rhabdochlamydiaceae bacterium]|nr:hypothetical protein [Rhabdochlamydiaceae bacterium]